MYMVNIENTAVEAELKTLKEIIINTVPVEQIYLFGSYANGIPHNGSDLSLFQNRLFCHRLLQFFGLRACKTAFLIGSCSKN